MMLSANCSTKHNALTHFHSHTLPLAHTSTRTHSNLHAPHSHTKQEVSETLHELRPREKVGQGFGINGCLAQVASSHLLGRHFGHVAYGSIKA